jgi:hypothetical protein
MIEVFYIVFGIPLIAGNAWLMFGKAERIRWHWALAIVLYAFAYIGIFHFLLKHI